MQTFICCMLHVMWCLITYEVLCEAECHSYFGPSHQFLFASNINFSEILETPSYLVLPSLCMKRPKTVLDLMHLKKDDTDASLYQQFFIEIRGERRDYIPVCVMCLVLQYFHQTQ